MFRPRRTLCSREGNGSEQTGDDGDVTGEKHVAHQARRESVRPLRHVSTGRATVKANDLAEIGRREMADSVGAEQGDEQAVA